MAAAKKRVVSRAKAEKAEKPEKTAKSAKVRAAEKLPSSPPVRRPSTRPPPAAWSPRTARAPWPGAGWPPENHDVAVAQDVMLMAYWIADQLGDPALPEARRSALTATLGSVAPMLRATAEGLVPFTVAAAVRRNGAILGDAQRYERARVGPGGVLTALLAAHEDEAVHACLRDIGVHSPDVAAWLSELERRGRPELRNALGEQAVEGAGETGPLLERLLLVVLFAAGKRQGVPGR